MIFSRCKLNCLQKKNPTQKFSLVAKCENCGSRIPIYQWSMKSADALANLDETDYIDDTKLLSESATTNIMKDKNLVVQANSLLEGKLVTGLLAFLFCFIKKIFCCNSCLKG